MNRRSLALAVVAVLLAVNLLSIALVAYPVSEKHPRPADEAFEPIDSAPSGEYRLAASIETDADGGSSDEIETRVLRPESGWYEGGESYRITDASRTVEIESETNALYAADVRWEFTRGTGTYLHYLMNREHSVTQEITSEQRTGNVSVESPEWVG